MRATHCVGILRAMKNLRALPLALALLFCSASLLTACGSGVDDTTSADSLDSAKKKNKCNTNKDCHNGQVCTNHLCQNPPPPPPTCHANTDCTNGQVCVAGVCQACTTDSQCVAGDICQSGKCVVAPPPPAGCKSNGDCGSGQVCVNGSCGACTANNQCSNGEVCKSGACTNPPPPPNGGCTNSDDCQNGGLCDNGTCNASACNNRASGKTGIRANVQITRYQGIIHGRNGDHEIAYGTLTNVLWIHDAATKDTNSVQLALNVSSSIDPTGLPHEIPFTVGQTVEVEGEYISGASAGSSGVAVIHFTHSTCGFVDVNGTQYR